MKVPSSSSSTGSWPSEFFLRNSGSLCARFEIRHAHALDRQPLFREIDAHLARIGRGIVFVIELHGIPRFGRRRVGWRDGRGQPGRALRSRPFQGEKPRVDPRRLPSIIRAHSPIFSVARVVELVDALDSKSSTARCVGSFRPRAPTYAAERAEVLHRSFSRRWTLSASAASVGEPNCALRKGPLKLRGSEGGLTGWRSCKTGPNSSSHQCAGPANPRNAELPCVQERSHDQFYDEGTHHGQRGTPIAMMPPRRARPPTNTIEVSRKNFEPFISMRGSWSRSPVRSRATAPTDNGNGCQTRCSPRTPRRSAPLRLRRPVRRKQAPGRKQRRVSAVREFRIDHVRPINIELILPLRRCCTGISVQDNFRITALRVRRTASPS